MDAKKILVAFDGSENALRAVAYTAAVIDGRQGFAVEVLCIERTPERDLFPDEATWKTACAERSGGMAEALDKARGMLLEKGLPESAVTTRFLPSCRSPLVEARECSLGTSIALEILRLAEEGGFGTVAVGRRGVSKQEEFLFGSVSSKIIHAAKGRAIWVVA